MTTIAWDGTELAGDKLASIYGTPHPVRKVWIRDTATLGPCLIGGSGIAAYVLEMRDWVIEGCEPSKLPKSQLDKDEFTDLMVITQSRKILHFQRGYVPMEVEQKTFTLGSGRDAAIVAMRYGATAREAVEVASEYDTGTGLGVDVVRFE